MKTISDTIAAVSTPPGIGGIAVVRISGPDAIPLVNSAWKGMDLTKAKSHSVHLGKYFNTEGNLLDEAVASVFIAPASFTGEDVVEISIHGSSWIQREILSDLIKRGARIANPGEFTQRAFLNGKIDLAQAEGVADLIASSSKAAHDLAMNQTKGSFSKEFNFLREKLIEFASLLELELDFSEEDVEFADREVLVTLCDEVLIKINTLAASYARGAVLKNGVPVVIAGIPNAGKSSLLNLLLNDEKAIVTDVPGTTRDIIEDTIEIDGVLYRFMDTAGLRSTTDKVEEIGVNKAQAALDKAYIVIWVIDPTQPLESQFKNLEQFSANHPSTHIVIIQNKADLGSTSPTPSTPIQIPDTLSTISNSASPIVFSTHSGLGLESLLLSLSSITKSNIKTESDTIVTNARHFEALTKASESLSRAKESLMSQVSGDFIAQDIRESISYLSSVTGNISSDTLLHSIFSRFCIGK